VSISSSIYPSMHVTQTIAS